MLSSETAIWDDILDYVKNAIPEVEYRTWFEQVRPLGIENGAFMIGVPHSFETGFATTMGFFSRKHSRVLVQTHQG